jgi:hypothetical protein
MNTKYENLVVRYGVDRNGGWVNIVHCDLRKAASLVSKPLEELYQELEDRHGFVRTMRYEIEARTIP